MGNVLIRCLLLRRRREKSGNCKLIGLTSVSGKMLEYLEIHFQPHKQHKCRKSQHRLSEGNPCLTSLVALCDDACGNEEGAGM